MWVDRVVSSCIVVLMPIEDPYLNRLARKWTILVTLIWLAAMMITGHLPSGVLF